MDEISYAAVDERAVASDALADRHDPVVVTLNTMNSHTSKYITIHQYECIMPKIRKKQTCTRKIYTIDYFQNCSHIHQQASPSITVA